MPVIVLGVEGETTVVEEVEADGPVRGARSQSPRVRSLGATLVVKAWWAGLSLVVPVVGLVVGQAVLLPRHFRVEPKLEVVDLTVAPPAVESSDASVIELAAFGDSAMAGVGVHHLEDVLAVQLAQRVADETGRPVHVVGYARSGARTVDVLHEQLPRLQVTPDVSVLVVGTNDVTAVTPVPSLVRSTRSLLDGLEALGAPVVMSGLPRFRAMRLLPHPLMEAVRLYGAVVAAVQRRAVAARPRVRLVDVGAVVGPHFFNDDATLSADAFHPSAAGYARIAEALLSPVLSALDAVPQRDVSPSPSGTGMRDDRP
ncbi:MAG TPA: SGNH/GDSL hydrolase family protein [Propionibacteriaceae bacterium]|nr:SGNH/GDSL hydrolase family protein [Propionibacteriaceae bacterium]